MLPTNKSYVSIMISINEGQEAIYGFCVIAAVRQNEKRKETDSDQES